MAKEVISERQKTVLQYAQFFFHEGPEKIGKIAGIPAHQVRYDLRNLVERGLLLSKRQINAASLGYYMFHIHLSVRSEDADRLLKVLSASSRVLYLSRNGGERTIGVTVLSRRPELIFAVMDEAAAKSNVSFSQIGWAVEGAFHYFGAKFLTGKSPIIPTNVQDWNGGPITIDQADAKILRLYNRGEAQSTAELARAIGLPTSTIQYRVNRLEQQNVILPMWAFVNLANLGYSEFEVLVRISNAPPAEHQRFVKFCEEQLSITLLIRSFGDWQYKFVSLVDRPTEIFELEDTLYRSFPSFVQKITIVARRETVKTGDFPVEDFT